MPVSGDNFFLTARNTLISGFFALPIILITVTGFLATSTANVGLIILFLGQLIAVPTLQILFSFPRSWTSVENIFGLEHGLTYSAQSRMCALSPWDVKNDMRPPITSYWIANLFFFSSYLMANAFDLYTIETKNSSAPGIENRKSQAITSILLIALFTGIFAGLYYSYAECETPGSMVLGATLFSALGYGIYQFAVKCGLAVSDVFGVASKLNLPLPGAQVAPYACVKINKGTAGAT
jgi:hypothetical protein